MFSFNVARAPAVPMTTPHSEAHKDPAGDQVLDVVVVGGSQAGLAMAWHLAQQGLRFVVLEAAPEVGHVWRSRWDSLKLFTPAQYDALPGMAFPAPPDTYPTKDPVADYLQAYAAAFDLPVRLNARVTDSAARRGRLRGPHRRCHLPGPAGGGGHRPVPGPLRPTAGRRIRPVGDPGPQRRLPQPPGPPEGPVLVVGAGTRASRSPRSWPPPAPSTYRSPPPIRCCPSGWPAGTCSGG